jgi:hypothetical protein
MPKSWIESITSKETGQGLIDILRMINSFFLSYDGNIKHTRCQIPLSYRRKGLWLTYVKYDNRVYTEFYNADSIDDDSWGDDSNWQRVTP